jgi:predicted membrane channel-forming protein YqfA (hemolysin III family)
MNRRTIVKLAVAYAITLAAAWTLLVFAVSQKVLVPTPNQSWAEIALFVVAAIGLLLVFFLIGVGLFVYHDAKRRGMEPVLLWVLVAVFVPYFIGLIVYLLARRPVQAVCPACGRRVTGEMVYCSRCGAAVKPMCAKCDRPMEGGARYCTHCGAEVTPA